MGHLLKLQFHFVLVGLHHVRLVQSSVPQLLNVVTLWGKKRKSGPSELSEQKEKNCVVHNTTFIIKRMLQYH